MKEKREKEVRERENKTRKNLTPIKSPCKSERRGKRYLLSTQKFTVEATPPHPHSST